MQLEAIQHVRRGRPECATGFFWIGHSSSAKLGSMNACSRLILATIASALLSEPAPAAADTPRVEVRNVRRVFHNGEHNAFTDLIRFKGTLYLTFRSCPDGHPVHPTASIIILSSADGEQWEQVHRFNVAGRDTRDPHFLIFRDRLFVYTGTWFCGDRSPAPDEYDVNRHLGYAVWSEDGREWQGPRHLEGTYGHYIWRAAAHGKKAYLCARRKLEFAETKSRSAQKALMEGAMLESDDGFIWKWAAFFQEDQGNETAFLFEPDGSIVAVARAGSQLCRSEPPYVDWQRTDLGLYLGGPLIAKWDGRTLVGGRKPDSGNRGPRTALYWLTEDGGLEEFAELPSGGDNSYPGFVELAPDRALVSWYSSHETGEDGKPITAIYLAELVRVN